MATMQTLEVWVMVGADGQYVADGDPARLNDRWEEDCGDIADAEGLRRVRLTVRVPLPEVIELSGEVQVSEAASDLKVA